MTAKRDSKSKPKSHKRPKIKKEKLKDLTADREGVKGGGGIANYTRQPGC